MFNDQSSEIEEEDFSHLKFSGDKVNGGREAQKSTILKRN